MLIKKSHFAKAVVLTLLSILLCFAVFAQTAEEKQKTIDSLAAIKQKQEAIKEVTKPEVVKNETSKPANSPKDTENINAIILKVTSLDNKTDSARIGETIEIKVMHLGALMKQQKITTFALYINGEKLDKLVPTSINTTTDTVSLTYVIDRTKDNDKAWAKVLGAPPLLEKGFFVKPVTISLGTDNNSVAIAPATDGYNFNLIRIQEGWFWACFVMIVIYLFFFGYMVKRKGLLRDRKIDLSALGINVNNNINPYSLGRFQMAFWFTLTVISFFFIWLITDAYNIITTTVLALIGISAGTSLSAAVIDDNKSSETLAQTIVLNDEKNALLALIATLAAGDPALLVPQSRLAVITPVIARNIQILTPQKSEGFLNDILRDVNGISFHRLQMLVWTMVLGLIFVYSVWKSLSMPDFDATLLALQGITSVTYLGFKFPEKQA